MKREERNGIQLPKMLGEKQNYLMSQETFGHLQLKNLDQMILF